MDQKIKEKGKKIKLRVENMAYIGREGDFAMLNTSIRWNHPFGDR